MPATSIYHVWFATKHRSWLIQGDVDSGVRTFIREVAQEKRIQLLECESAVDHMHLLLRLGEGQSLPKVMNLLKGNSSYRLHRGISRTEAGHRVRTLLAARVQLRGRRARLIGGASSVR